MALTILGDDGFSLLVGKIFDSLLRFQMELNPEPFVRCVDQAKGMAAVAVHVAIGVRDASLAHGNGDLVQRLG
ncbi:hypothetical protein ES708_31852 [subsurface metagenome]